jgi:hypothetical protein
MSNAGRFGWYELLTSDVKGGIAFYKAVTGWDTQKWEGPMDYTMWTAGTTPLGGVMTLPDAAKKMGAPPHWLAYVSVADVDASTKQAQGLGARVNVPPTDIGDAGRFSVIADPQGAVFALHASKTEMPGWAQPEPPTQGAISWHELVTTDWESALRFYATMFGWKKTEAMEMGPEMGTYQMFGKDGKTFGGMMNKPKGYPAPPNWLLYTYVKDLDAALTTVTARGGKILNGPMPIPGGDRVAQCMDPQGAAFALHGK